MEALSCEFRTGCPWELLYASDFVIVAESLDELKMSLNNWKEGLEVKRLKVNFWKKKVMCSTYYIPNIKITSVKFPYGVCWKSVGNGDLVSGKI